MRNLIVIAYLLTGIFAGCSKENKGCVAVKPEAEESKILDYITSNGYSAVKHPSGIYYVISNPGNGATATVSSMISVTYSGKFLNGTEFDESATPLSLRLSSVIEGWQIGIPLIKPGGKIKLIIPSAYAYGCNGSGPIPPNEILVFDIDLISVQ